MTKDEALRMALEKVANALPAYIEDTPAREYLAVIHSALAAPVQEPVAWVPILTWRWNNEQGYWEGRTITPLAAKRQWVGLTDEEIDAIYEQHHNQYAECISVNFGYERALEAKLKERNQ
jgi:hypothetical protein